MHRMVSEGPLCLILVFFSSYYQTEISRNPEIQHMEVPVYMQTTPISDFVLKGHSEVAISDVVITSTAEPQIYHLNDCHENPKLLRMWLKEIISSCLLYVASSLNFLLSIVIRYLEINIKHKL